MTVTDLVVTNDVAQLEQLTPSAQEASVTLYLTEARDKLAVAVEMSGPAAVALVHAEIATAAAATKHLGLSREIQIDAVEMVRRAEFALNKAIRVGQARGEIRKPGSDSRVDLVGHNNLVSPTEFASKDSLYGNGNGFMHLGDSEQHFEEALSEAKAEGNVSRANVVRKIRGDAAPKGDRPEVLRGTRRLDSNKIVAGTVEGAIVPTSLLEHVDYSALDREHIDEWIDSLAESIKALTALRKRLAAELTKEPIQ